MSMRLAAIVVAAIAGSAAPAFAQDAAPIPQGGNVVEIGQGSDVTSRYTGLPGVGLEPSSSSRSTSPTGPGGLSNGIGAYGVMAPDASGTAGNASTRIPGAIPDTNSGVGIPFN